MTFPIGSKATSLINLAKSLKSAGTPLDGIGFQSHFIVGEVPTSMSTVMNEATALGLEVQYLLYLYLKLVDG